jgi:hypothetical protein
MLLDALFQYSEKGFFEQAVRQSLVLGTNCIANRPHVIHIAQFGQISSAVVQVLKSIGLEG